MRALLPLLLAGASLAGCATTPAITGLAPVPVTATGETAPVGTGNADAADDPAIWRNAADPAASLIVATDKKAGLYVYGLDGTVRSFFDAGRVNNVDLVDMGAQGIIVIASDRNDVTAAKAQLFRLDPASATLTRLAILPVGAGEAYGMCATGRDGTLLIYSPVKEGAIYEQRIALGTTPTAEGLRTLRVATQPEGCIVDHRDGTLYVGEEDAGIWRFRTGAATGEMVAAVDNRYLVADVEGLGLVPAGANGGWLVASSQGDNAYAVFRLPDMAPLGRFAVVPGAIGGSEETDGLEVIAGDFGPDYPEGLFVAQDGHNQPAAQNFKLVSWAAIKAALGI
ncbi:3-phytase [Croceibacterium mercuriale]|uniref:3-phytase n=1 Tax=Croceibacterium mercuriale TaxID=1572751 RepID=A0A0B2BSM8_9SPHN|nr:phytase [Croceibacterium mercuriale]KHL24434.1 3-phytase [Croceibacterium mercuriale]